MNLLQKIELFTNDEMVTTGDVSVNTAKGKIDVIGGECPKGMSYDKSKKVCIPSKNEDKGFVYIINKKKHKEMKIPNDPRVIKKYKAKGFEIKESSVAAAVAGSGQTRVWGERHGWMLDFDRKEPVEAEMADKAKQNILGRRSLTFDTVIGSYVPHGDTKVEPRYIDLIKGEIG